MKLYAINTGQVEVDNINVDMMVMVNNEGDIIEDYAKKYQVERVLEVWKLSDII